MTPIVFGQSGVIFAKPTVRRRGQFLPGDLVSKLITTGRYRVFWVTYSAKLTAKRCGVKHSFAIAKDCGFRKSTRGAPIIKGEPPEIMNRDTFWSVVTVVGTTSICWDMEKIGTRLRAFLP